MNIERRALYTSLRLNWLKDPTVSVEDWQVEDYREMPYSVLFERLRQNNFNLDRVIFLAYAEEFDSPEEFCDELLKEHRMDSRIQDQVYLVVFELWRRLLPEKPCLSVFCDELDYQISVYDDAEINNSEQLQDVIANLQIILEENADQGGEPHAVFEYVSSGCAHDIESFLLDYIADQIDNSNFAYASDLLEGFSDYFTEYKWFELQRIRLLAQNDPRNANRMIQQLLDDSCEDEDRLDFYLEVLHFFATEGDSSLFRDIYSKTIPLLNSEEDLNDLIELCVEYHQNRDNNGKVVALQNLKAERHHINASTQLNHNDAGLTTLNKLMSL